MERDPDNAMDAPPRVDRRRSLCSIRLGATDPAPTGKSHLLAKIASELAAQFELDAEKAEAVVYLSIARSVLFLLEMAEEAGLEPPDERLLTWIGVGVMELLGEAEAAHQPANDR